MIHLVIFIGGHYVSRNESEHRFFKENSSSSIALVGPSRIQSPNCDSKQHHDLQKNLQVGIFFFVFREIF